MVEEQEKKRNRIALLTSLGIHGGIVLLLLFMVAWRAPNPPLEEYGIELNFGMDTQGSGDVQPETPVGAAETEPEEQLEPLEELPAPEPEEIPEEEVVEESKPVESNPVQPEAVSKTESPVVVEEKKEVKPVEKPIEKKPDVKVVEAKPEVKPEKETPKAVYKPKTDASTEGTSKEKQGAPGNQGDDVNKAGDKGDPEGALDAKALYGKQGGGGGGVSMSGFKGFGWPTVETPGLPDESYGVYEFIVKVDDQGYVVSVTPLQRGLSFEAERRLKTAIQKLQFIPKGTNLPAQSEGRITFKVVSERE
jgi:outer membrane biosynthesis protein TonB